jgi:hypothetical protein
VARWIGADAATLSAMLRDFDRGRRARTPMPIGAERRAKVLRYLCLLRLPRLSGVTV